MASDELAVDCGVFISVSQAIEPCVESFQPHSIAALSPVWLARRCCVIANSTLDRYSLRHTHTHTDRRI